MKLPPILPRKPKREERPWCPKCRVGLMLPETEVWESQGSDTEIMFYVWKCPYCSHKVRI